MSRTFAYFRVNSADQSTQDQADAIHAAGFVVEPDRMFVETVSGSTSAMNRTDFKRLIDQLKAGDALIVTQLDCLGRDAMDVRTTIDTLAGGGVGVHCLALGAGDLTSEAGRESMMVIRAVADFERNLLNEQIRAGLERAKAGGILLGRPYTLSDEQHAEIWARRTQGASLGELAKEFGVSRSMIQRVEKRSTGPARFRREAGERQ